ncbi:unnamed protein product [Brassica oleracea]
MASYVFNDNYLKSGLADEACSFNNNAALTSIDPSKYRSFFANIVLSMSEVSNRFGSWIV